MSRGRPPSWNPFASLELDVWTEVAEFGSKGRIGISAAARRRLPWFASAVNCGMLATLEPDGFSRLESWDGVGEARIAEVGESIARTPHRRTEIALAAMDRYMFVSVEISGRLVAPANLVSHVDPTQSGRARIVVRDGQLWLWSEILWQSKRSESLAMLGEVGDQLAPAASSKRPT